jgi:hypothetical protein
MGGRGGCTSEKTKNVEGRKSNPNRKSKLEYKQTQHKFKKSINEIKYCGI